jgi:hypothetical protein
MSSTLRLTTIKDNILSKWAKDAHRFLKVHWNELRLNPIVVYWLFAFTPKSTIFQTVYAKIRSFPHPVVTTGLEDDWSASSSVSSHPIKVACLSPCSNWFATGGNEGPHAVYGLWNVESADGETHIHPCHTTDCWVSHVWFYEYNSALQLQTLCKCSLLCRWDPFARPHILLDKSSLDPSQIYEWWNEDGSKAVTQQEQRGRFLYSLWKRNTPYDLIPLDESEEPWLLCKFAPGMSEKLAWQADDHLLVMWDCTRRKQLFSKTTYYMKDLSRVSLTFDTFSPNAKIIVLKAQDAGRLFCLSSEDGAKICEVDFDTSFLGRVLFCPCSQKFAILNGECMAIINVADGSTLAKDLDMEDISPLLPHLEDEKTKKLIQTEMYCSKYSWNDSPRPHVQTLNQAPVPAKHIHLSWQHSILVETSEHQISFKSWDLPFPRISYQEALDSVSYNSLSPNGQYLAIVTRHCIQVRDNRTGIHLLSHDAFLIGDFVRPEMDFNHDSTSLIVWDQTFVHLLCIKTSSAMSFQFDYLYTAVFFNSNLSPCFLAVETDGELYQYSLDGHRKSYGRLSSPPSQNTESLNSNYPKLNAAISPDDTILAIIDGGTLIVKDISSNGQEWYWPGACLGLIFSPDNERLTVVESINWGFLTTSHLKIPEFILRNSWTDLTPPWSEYTVDLRHAEHQLRVLPAHSRQSFIFFVVDSHNGNEIIPPSVYRSRDGWLQYGQRRLDYFLPKGKPGISPFAQVCGIEPFAQICGDYIQWLKQNGESIVVDMSLLTKYMYVVVFTLPYTHLLL